MLTLVVLALVDDGCPSKRNSCESLHNDSELARVTFCINRKLPCCRNVRTNRSNLVLVLALVLVLVLVGL